MQSAVHFVWFRGEEFNSAKKVWGEPDFIHRGWDKRARREILDGDTIVFARGAGDQATVEHNLPDLDEREPD